MSFQTVQELPCHSVQAESMIRNLYKMQISKSVSQTHKIADNLLKNLANANLLCLYGELGAGKTTFVQGLAKSLGIKKRVISPTFVMMREYPIIANSQLLIINFLYHIDLYRIESEKDAISLNLKELWSGSNNLVIIEWAEKIKKILPKKRIDVKFSYVSQNKRKISIIHRH